MCVSVCVLKDERNNGSESCEIKLERNDDDEERRRKTNKERCSEKEKERRKR